MWEFLVLSGWLNKSAHHPSVSAVADTPAGVAGEATKFCFGILSAKVFTDRAGGTLGQPNVITLDAVSYVAFIGFYA